MYLVDTLLTNALLRLSDLRCIIIAKQFEQGK